MPDTALQLTMESVDLAATIELDAAMNYALAHNGISPLRGVRIENRSSSTVGDLQLEVTLAAPLDGRVAAPLRCALPTVPGNDELAIPGHGVRWSFDAATFAQIDEAVTASLSARVFDSQRMLRAEGTLRLLARDEWWFSAIHESLAAFVTPRARAIQDLVGEASDRLDHETGDPSLQGYQGGADRARAIATAIYEAMRARSIRYINPPASFEGTGQKIRPPHEVLVDRWGTCLDLATTYAGALEHAGLHPVLVLCQGHAFAGHLLEEQQLPELVVQDPRVILNYVESGLLIPVETTSLCPGDRSAPFREAIAATREAGFWSHHIDDVLCLIDVVAAHRSVRPLPPISIENGVRIVEVERRTAPELPPVVRRAPDEPIPPPRGGARPKRVYPPRVERWRSSLLDLSFRNPLLNMRSGNAALDLHVPRGSLGTVEDLLFDGKSLTVLPHDRLAEIHLARGARTAQDIEPETLHAMLAKESAIFAGCTEAKYVSRLRGFQRRARTVLEETGANNLFVTLGTLEWEDAGRQARAPLFLLPVTIRASRGRPYQIQIEEGGYAQPNQCLLEKLRIGHGLTIPEFADPESDESGIDLAGALQAIRLALADAQLAFAVEESAHLALLQFSTLQLWQDLSENWETFLANPVVRHLIETPTDSFTDPATENPVRDDAEAEGFCPISIDGSQLEAVTWAEAGRSFVLEGPPGTGKSQTITNLIANALATGQTVLFVAEKQAALDVVRTRLNRVGLADLCLDLHGKDQTPENVRKQLRAALQSRVERNEASWMAVRSRHQTAVDSLRRYPPALHEAGPAGLSAWTARQARLTSGDGPTAEVPRATVAQALDAEALYRAARELTQALYDLGFAPHAHPWRLAELSERRDGITDAVRAMRNATDALPATHAALIDAAGVEPVARWLAATVAVPGFALSAEAIEAASREEWNTALHRVLGLVAVLRRDAQSLLASFTPDIVTADLDALLIRAKAADAKLFKGKPRKAIVADLVPVTRPGVALDRGTLTPTLEALITLRTRVRDVQSQATTIAGLALPTDWNPLSENADDLPSAQVDAIHAAVQLAEAVPARELATTPPTEHDLARVTDFRDAWSALTAVLQCTPESLTAWRGDRSELAAITASLPAWTADAPLVQLARWITVRELLGRLQAAGLTVFAAEILGGALPLDEIEPALRRGVAEAALVERLDAPALNGFDGVARDRSIERFASGSEEMRRDMLTELPAQILAGRTFSPEHLVGKAGQLSREVGRKRGGQKIRELFTNFGPIIAELTPCLMMSPHSVARFLPASALEIDLVVFDEASQIRVAEAISAMGRAKATVVVGDSQQMPPSNLMTTNAIDDDTPQPDGIPSDMESVLSEAVESNLPRLWLSWHYRSQHESLIAFSNHQYYDGRLASFPRSPETRSDLGVSWRRIDGTFERGSERVNRGEASAIVEEIRHRLAADPSASIGVVTFNTQQRDLIMDQLEESAEPRVAAALAADEDPLFVKNLENVQGDERDVILFSLAFSPNPDTGQLPLNFGPLIRAGGERRLNVAVTRARARVVLFSSFDPHHIDLSRTSSVGLAHLRAYMEMAERETDDPAVLRPAASRDLHHDDVVEAVKAAGLLVQRNVGLSEFKVDLAVASRPEGPWVAVFLDGPTYARRATVADRESLPHGVLTGSMGWNRVVRVWLPDWLRDRDEVIARLARATAQTAPPPSPAAPEVPSVPEPPPIVVPVAEPEPVLAPFRAAPAVAPQAQLPEFAPAHEEFVGDREILDALAYSGEARRLVRAEIDDVIVSEGPVAVVRLARIVGRRFDLQRVAANRTAAIAGLIDPGRLERTPFGDVAWPAGVDPTTYDTFRRTPEGVVRTLEEIAPREVVNAMRHLARIGHGIGREELVIETARLFGIQRPAGKRAHLESVLDHALRKGLLTEDGGAITSPVRNGSGPTT